VSQAQQAFADLPPQDMRIGFPYASQPNYKDQRAVEWNLQVQQQLEPTTVFSLGYAGSKSTRLNYTGFANAAQACVELGDYDAGSGGCVEVYAVGWRRTGTTQSTRAMGTTMRCWWDCRNGFSNSLNSIVSYNVVEVAGQQQRMVRSGEWHGAGGSVVQNYFDPRNAYGISSYDLRHYFFVEHRLFAFRSGRGKRWLQTGIASYVLGGWKAKLPVPDPLGAALQT